TGAEQSQRDEDRVSEKSGSAKRKSITRRQTHAAASPSFSELCVSWDAIWTPPIEHVFHEFLEMRDRVFVPWGEEMGPGCGEECSPGPAAAGAIDQLRRIRSLHDDRSHHVGMDRTDEFVGARLVELEGKCVVLLKPARAKETAVAHHRMR